MKLDKLERGLVLFFVIVSSVSLQTVIEGWGADAQGVDSHIPNLAGIWDGTPRSRPVNGERVPWGEDNFTDLNERARA